MPVFDVRPSTNDFFSILPHRHTEDPVRLSAGGVWVYFDPTLQGLRLTSQLLDAVLSLRLFMLDLIRRLERDREERSKIRSEKLMRRISTCLYSYCRL